MFAEEVRIRTSGKTQAEEWVMTALVRAAALMNFAEVARQFGLDPRLLVRQAGLDPRTLNNPDLRIPARTVAGLLEDAAQRSQCPTFGLRMAESRRLADFGAVSLLITHQATVRSALATVVQYLYFLNEALALQIEDTGDMVILREELVVESRGPNRQSYELAVGTLFRTFHSLLGRNWAPINVHFAHAAPADLRVHHRLFGHTVVFDSDFNGIVCAAADLDRPNPGADPRLAEYARQFVETLPRAAREPTTLVVRKAIYFLLPAGRAGIAEVAAGLGLSLRTLQRRLDAEGSDFSALVDDVRRDLAVRYMDSPGRSLTEVSEMLGYAQLSSFTRWFASAFGVPPSKWRLSRRCCVDQGFVR